LGKQNNRHHHHVAKEKQKLLVKHCGSVGDFIQMTLGREMMVNGYGVHFVKYGVT
jgi:hypothetical protein